MMTIVGVAALALGAAAQDPLQGQGWATFNVGSWVKLRTTVEQPGKKFESELRAELVSRSAEVVVLERTMTAIVDGKPGRSETQRVTVSTTPSKPNKVEQEGDEEIELAGKKLQCHWLEIRQDSQGAQNRVRMWFSPEIPGGLARVQTTPEKGVGLTVRVAAVAWEKK
jgi:hypothetical protein